MRSDHLDIAFLEKLLVERIAVVGAVADQLFRVLVEERVVEGEVDELSFMR